MAALCGCNGCSRYGERGTALLVSAERTYLPSTFERRRTLLGMVGGKLVGRVVVGYKLVRAVS